jgi:rhamnose transport system ATP-binding protein
MDLSERWDDAAVDLEVKGLTKRFGATLALDQVDLKIASGQIHALVGENGAGKSTLGKILSGVYQPDSGQLLLAGRSIEIRSPREALSHGITIIAQELSLVPSRSVIENVFLGIEAHRGAWVLKKSIRIRYAELMETSGIHVPADVTVASLKMGDQQKVEILRALARNAQVIVMDEPTARLSAEETMVLKEVMKSLKERGKTVVFVSHFLGDVLSISDAVTIMRDGRVIRTSHPSIETHNSLVEAMTGRTIDDSFPNKVFVADEAREVLVVNGLTRSGVFNDISFNVKAGEIVALAGLVGAGRSELVRAVFGADRFDSGEIFLDGNPLVAHHPSQAISQGIAMIPESRKDQGLLLDRSVSENISLPYLKRLSKRLLINLSAESKLVNENMAITGVRAGSPSHLVRSLSGGNQQKVLFARSAAGRPKLLIADEPTRGVDVGAKRAIYDLIVRQAEAGMAVLIVSSELDEVIGLAHRVLVMREGEIVNELRGDEVTENDVITSAFSTERSERLAQ